MSMANSDSKQLTVYSWQSKKVPPFEFQDDFDKNHKWHDVEGENIVKGDFRTDNGARILMFSTDANLSIMTKAKGLAIDGTFKLGKYTKVARINVCCLQTPSQ